MEELINAIAKFSSAVSYQVVEATLLPILEVAVVAYYDDASLKDDDCSCKQEESTTTTNSRITPLMIACDKGQVETVRFLVHCPRHYQPIVGHVWDKAPDSGNMAVHYAAMSGKVEIFEQLLVLHHNTAAAAAAAKTLPCRNNNNNNVKKSSNRQQNNLTPLESMRNVHGDTPIMMACVQGCHELLQKLLAKTKGRTPQTIFLLLQLRNESNDSALSLACGYGHVEIVKLLLDAAAPGISTSTSTTTASSSSSCSIAQQDDLVTATAALSKLNSLLKAVPQQVQLSSSSNGNNIGQQQQQWRLMQNKRNQIQQCVDLVREALQQKTAALAQELEREEIDDDDDDKSPVLSRPAKKTRSKQTSRKSSSSSSRKEMKGGRFENGQTVEQEQEEVDKSGEKQQEAVTLTTLKDGTRAVAVQGTSYLEVLEEAPSESTAAVHHHFSLPHQHKSVNELFRERLATTTTGGGAPGDSSAEEIGDIMEALCLEVSQLLLPPHGMALNLSPSQLDAVDQILERQLKAVQQAREIQARLHETAK